MRQRNREGVEISLSLSLFVPNEPDADADDDMEASLQMLMTLARYHLVSLLLPETMLLLLLILSSSHYEKERSHKGRREKAMHFLHSHHTKSASGVSNRFPDKVTVIPKFANRETGGEVGARKLEFYEVNRNSTKRSQYWRSLCDYLSVPTLFMCLCLSSLSISFQADPFLFSFRAPVILPRKEKRERETPFLFPCHVILCDHETQTCTLLTLAIHLWSGKRRSSSSQREKS